MDKIITLQERIDAIEGEPIIHIGSKSSFFFIGTKEEYERNIDLVSDMLLSDMQDSLYTAQQAEEYFRGILNEIVRINPSTTDEKELKRIGNIAKSIQSGTLPAIRRITSIPEFEENIRNFKPVRERASEKPYVRISDDNGIVIIVEGCEKGKYWSYDEYKNGIAADDEEEAKVDGCKEMKNGYVEHWPRRTPKKTGK